MGLDLRLSRWRDAWWPPEARAAALTATFAPMVCTARLARGPGCIDGSTVSEHGSHVDDARRRESAMVEEVWLPADLERRLQDMAERSGRPESFYVRQALERHLDVLEEAYWADKAIRHWQADGRESRPLADLKAELGL